MFIDITYAQSNFFLAFLRFHAHNSVTLHLNSMSSHVHDSTLSLLITQNLNPILEAEVLASA
jgi:hypothetical protein